MANGDCFGADLPEAAAEVLDVCEAEAWANTDYGDAHTAADVAADIVRVLTRHYLGGE